MQKIFKNMNLVTVLLSAVFATLLFMYGPCVWTLLHLSAVKFSIVCFLLSVCIAFVFTSLFAGGFEARREQSIYQRADFWDLCKSITLVFAIFGLVFGLVLDCIWAGVAGLLPQ